MTDSTVSKNQAETTSFTCSACGQVFYSLDNEYLAKAHECPHRGDFDTVDYCKLCELGRHASFHLKLNNSLLNGDKFSKPFQKVSPYATASELLMPKEIYGNLPLKLYTITEQQHSALRFEIHQTSNHATKRRLSAFSAWPHQPKS